MRLIDADALMRIYQEVLCPHVSCADCSLLMNDGNCRFETMIRETLAIDAVPATVQEWISVNDRLPEDDLPKDTKKKMIRCLVYTNKGTIKPCVRQRWEVNGKLVPWQWNKDLFAKPTHWMYYPQPPKGE